MKRGASPAVILFLIITFGFAHAEENVSISRQFELVKLVRNDCGSCHGLTLKGGLGPALLPINLQEKAKESLCETILHGRTGTAMPPWSAFLNEVEVSWIVEQLMKGFPNAD
jgi:cytochrome c55X